MTCVKAGTSSISTADGSREPQAILRAACPTGLTATTVDGSTNIMGCHLTAFEARPVFHQTRTATIVGGLSPPSAGGLHSIDRSGSIMRKIIPTIAFAIGVSTAAIAQQPAPMTSGPAEIFSRLPAGTTVTNFYKQNVYDPSDNKIGEVDDVLIDKEGRVTALIIGVGGFLGMGEKDVAIPFSALHASEKNNKWYLVLNTTKDALKTAPGFTYDKTKTTWVSAAR